MIMANSEYDVCAMKVSTDECLACCRDFSGIDDDIDDPTLAYNAEIALQTCSYLCNQASNPR